jgi:hypothetical protein
MKKKYIQFHSITVYYQFLFNNATEQENSFCNFVLYEVCWKERQGTYRKIRF